MADLGSRPVRESTPKPDPSKPYWTQLAESGLHKKVIPLVPAQLTYLEYRGCRIVLADQPVRSRFWSNSTGPYETTVAGEWLVGFAFGGKLGPFLKEWF